MAAVFRAADVTDESSKIMRIADYAGDRDGPPPEQAATLPLLTLDQLREQARGVKWVVKHLIPAESVGVLFGASGTFKSFIAIDMALHVAHGLPWLGKKTQQGPVLIIAAEGGTGLWRRIVAWHQQRMLPWKDAPVFVVPIAVDLATDAILVREAAAAVGVVPKLVVVDTLSQTFIGEENSSQEISTYLREIGLQFRMCWLCAILVVHHTGHLATERPRGSSAIRANVDFMYGVFRDEKEMLATVECVKQKDGEMPDPMMFSMNVREVSRDEDDEAITSLVATSVDGAQQVLGVMAHEASRGRGGHKSLFLELAHNGVEEKKLRALFYDSCDISSPDARKQAYHRARRWAIESQIIEIAQGVVIRPE